MKKHELASLYSEEEYWNRKLYSALITLYNNVPDGFISELLALARNIYANALANSRFENHAAKDVLLDVIEAICARANNHEVSEFLSYINNNLPQSQEDRLGSIPIILTERIKISKRRRFLKQPTA